MKHLIIALAVLSQPFLIQLAPPIEDAKKPIEIAEFPAVKPIEKITLTLPQAPVERVSVSGSWIDQCKAWAQQAGFTLPTAAIALIDKESDCNPAAQNPHSTAYGIGQFLNSTWGIVGCRKTSNPVEQLRCMKLYVDNVRGGWSAAWAYWLAHGSY